jgi:hypothetical protein
MSNHSVHRGRPETMRIGDRVGCRHLACNMNSGSYRGAEGLPARLTDIFAASFSCEGGRNSLVGGDQGIDNGIDCVIMDKEPLAKNPFALRTGFLGDPLTGYIADLD